MTVSDNVRKVVADVSEATPDERIRQFYAIMQAELS
jgi:hypothetical protein